MCSDEQCQYIFIILRIFMYMSKPKYFKMYSHHSSIINCNIPRRSHLVFCWFGVWDLYMFFYSTQTLNCDTCTYNESSSAFVCKLITRSGLSSSPRSQLQQNVAQSKLFQLKGESFLWFFFFWYLFLCKIQCS